MKTKDIYVPKKVPRIEVREKLHGHTKILLRDVRTGKVERVEHDNTFTDGLDSYLKTFGTFNNTIFNWANGSNQAPWINLLGGIFLFDTALPTSPMAKYMPAGTTMTANGRYGVANASTPTELGSYNSVESTSGENSFSLVYDWGTSQGNGIIASVALTSISGGGIGYGNASKTQHLPLYSPSDNQVGNTISIPYGNDSSRYLYKDNYFYNPEAKTFGIGTSEVKVYKKFSDVDELDIFKVPREYFDTSSEYITFTLSTPLPGDFFIWPAGAEYPDCFALLPAQVPSGNTMYVYLLDVSDGTTTQITMQNNTGEATRSYGLFIVGNDKMLIQGESGKCYLVTMSTSAVVGEASNVPTTNLGLMSSFTDELYMSTGGNSSLYDPVLNRFLPTNGDISIGTYTQHFYYEEDDFLLSRYFRNGSAGANYGITKHPLRLMTINNLQSAVTKDATKTMKVTYTVTRSS